MPQMVVKGQGRKVLNLEAELLETAKRASKKATKSGETMTYKDQDEKLLRDKLVNRLKEKEVLKMEHFGERLKNAKENNYFDSSDDGVEDISDDDLDQDEEYGEEFKGKEDEELRLTSTDDDEKIKDISDDDIKRGSKDGDTPPNISSEIKIEPVNDVKSKNRTKEERTRNGGSKFTDLYDSLPKPVKIQELGDDKDSDDSTAKNKKKKKKDKKEKKKKKKKEKDRSDKDDSRKKKRELESQIYLAKRIAEKEKREKKNSHESDDNQNQEHDNRNTRGIRSDSNIDRKTAHMDDKEKSGYPDYREKMLAQRREAARERKATLLLQQKKQEQAKDEVYDQLVKGGGTTTKSSDKMRKLKKGEHYEDAQREFLENEIRIRERREQYGASENSSNRRVDFSKRGGAADFVDSRYHFAGRERNRSSNRYDQQDDNYERRQSRPHNYERR